MIPLRLALAQVNPTVGDLEGNRRLIEARLEEARSKGARAVVFPELVLTGYPPEDLLLNPSFLRSARSALEALLPATRGLLALVGLPLRDDSASDGRSLHNAAAVLLDGRWIDTYAKGSLPNYGVFDEKRYFRPGLRCPVYTWGRLRFGVNICEDLWALQGVPAVQARAGARLLLNLSSSPYHADKGLEREALLCRRARRHGVAIAYTNLVGGQDELVFDGESLIVDAGGRVQARAPQFEEALLVVDIEPGWLEPPTSRPGEPAVAAAASIRVRSAAPPVGFHPAGFPSPQAPGLTDFTEPRSEPIDELEAQFRADRVDLGHPAASRDAGRSDSAPTDGTPADPALAAMESPPALIAPRMEDEAEIYAALRLGLRDYVEKNRFPTVILGLSGGIDSALTAALAVDALGAARVHGVSMPSRFNSETSKQGARDVAAALGIAFREIPIEDAYAAFRRSLAPVFGDLPEDVTEENLQARIRGTILMALSNKFGHLVLTTGNKSELAVGYCTLYGDMAGGFAVIKDVPKTLVYRLARWRNGLSPVIPEDTLTRPPSAELRADQTDQDTLPSYEVLDAIVQARMEGEEDPAALVARGLDPAWVMKVYRWIDGNEYKRRQAPPGIKITPRAFGRDRRYPITNRFSWGP